MPDATFQVFDDDAGVRWRLQDGDGAVLAVSDGAYDTEHDAMRAVQRLKHVAATASVESATGDT